MSLPYDLFGVPAAPSSPFWQSPTAAPLPVLSLEDDLGFFDFDRPWVIGDHDSVSLDDEPFAFFPDTEVLTLESMGFSSSSSSDDDDDGSEEGGAHQRGMVLASPTCSDASFSSTTSETSEDASSQPRPAKRRRRTAAASSGTSRQPRVKKPVSSPRQGPTKRQRVKAQTTVPCHTHAHVAAAYPTAAAATTAAAVPPAQPPVSGATGGCGAAAPRKAPLGANLPYKGHHACRFPGCKKKYRWPDYLCGGHGGGRCQVDFYWPGHPACSNFHQSKNAKGKLLCGIHCTEVDQATYGDKMRQGRA